MKNPKPTPLAVEKLDYLLRQLDRWRDNYMQYDPHSESLVAANKLQMLLDGLKLQRKMDEPLDGPPGT